MGHASAELRLITKVVKERKKSKRILGIRLGSSRKKTTELVARAPTESEFQAVVELLLARVTAAIQPLVAGLRDEL